MSAVITGVVTLAFGLISKKIRSYGAEKLQDGGLVDQKFRGLIVRELDDIKSKLDAISRKDLCTSISFLRNGVQRLQMSSAESSESGNLSTSELPKDGKQSQDTTKACASASSTNKKPAQRSVSVENAVTLANAIGKLKIESNELFELAKESFKKAGEKATEAFHNAALSTEERILASKVRITSGILEHINRPEIASSDCLLYLKELHDIPAIKEIFSVHIQGGIKSIFMKESRMEIVETVTMINFILADFISKFTKRRMGVFDWPMIECGKLFVHPIHFKKESLPSLEEMGITPPWDIVVLEEEYKRGAFNQKGDLIYFDYDRCGLRKLDKTTGKLQPHCRSSVEDNTEHPQPKGKVIDVAVDEDDTLYVLSDDENVGCTLSVYSADGESTNHCALEFLKLQECLKISIDVNNDKNIIIGCQLLPGEEGSKSLLLGITVYLCNSKGELINSFDTGLKDHFLKCVSVSCNNEITLAARKKWSGGVKHSNYTEDGQLQKTVKFHVSEGSGFFNRIFYDQDTKNIISCTTKCNDDETMKICMEYFSEETGELLFSYLLYNINVPVSMSLFELVCHTNGTLVFACREHVIFLRKLPS